MSMTTSATSTPGEKITALVSAVISAFAPAYELMAGLLELDWHPSIYQPGIYGSVPKFFLILPLVIGLYAGWRAVTRRGAITWIFVGCIAMIVVVAGMYYGLPSESPFHQANWVFSYVAVSLSSALAIGIISSLLLRS